MFFLNTTVKSFTVGIHLGCSRVSVTMGEIQIFNLLIKMFHEFTTVVGQHILDIGEGNYISSRAIDDSFYHVKRSTMPGVFSYKVLGFPRSFSSFKRYLLTIMSNFNREFS